MSIRDVINKFIQNQNDINVENDKLDEIINAIDFSEVENQLGFTFHTELKNYLNSYYFDEIT